MIHRFGSALTLLLAAGVLFSASCKKKKAEDDFSNVKGNYFSIYQYGVDAWNTYEGPPFLIVKSIRIDEGKTDSSYTNSDTINWAPIFKTFFATDISDRKYLGQYNFNQFDDPQDLTHNFFYKAKEDDMFTQKLLITIDQQTSKCRGIYIETFEKSTFGETTQKLYYKPLRTIQIQTDSKPLFGKRKFTVQQWDFVLAGQV
jgi:hypothetical protein